MNCLTKKNPNLQPDLQPSVYPFTGVCGGEGDFGDSGVICLNSLVGTGNAKECSS